MTTASARRVIRIDWDTWRKTDATMRRILGAKSFQEASSDVADAVDQLRAFNLRAAEERRAHDAQQHESSRQDPHLPGMAAWLRKQGR